MPVLSKILSEFEVEGSVYFCEVMSPPWSLDFSDKKVASFHCVRRGGCSLKMGDTTHWLGPGDVAIVLKGEPHIIDGQAAAAPSFQRDVDTLLVCGYFSFRQDFPHPLFQAFPPVLILREEEVAKSVWLKSSLDYLVHETSSPSPGTPHILNRMTEVLLVQFFRCFISLDPEQTTFVAALFDKKIGPALQLLHSEPEKAWTLDNVAQTLGMSRASLAQRFTTLTGMPLFTYLTDLRMRQAANMLRTTDLSVAEIGEAVGYMSDAAFNRTFRKFAGKSALSYRSDTKKPRIT